MFVWKIKSQRLCSYSLYWSGVPVLDNLLKLTLQFNSLSDTFLTADMLLKIGYSLIMSISILSWCLILALLPLSIGVIAYRSSRPHLSRVSTKNKHRSLPNLLHWTHPCFSYAFFIQLYLLYNVSKLIFNVNEERIYFAVVST